MDTPDNVSAVHYRDANLGSLVCNDRTSKNYVYDYDYIDYSGIPVATAETVLFLIFCLLIIAGNLTVMIWRCSRRREERNSIPSLLVLNLAAADLLLGIQLVIFLCLYSWSCSALNSPNSMQIKLMTSLCCVSGVMESTSILMSGIITGTIGFYYANVMFGERCCCCIKRTCVIGFLCTGWIVIAGLGVAATMFPIAQDPWHPMALTFNNTDSLLYMAANVPIYTQDNLTNNLISTNTTISLVKFGHCVPITSFIGEIMITFLANYQQNRTVHAIVGIAFGIDLLLIGTAAGIYILIADKLRRSRTSAASSSLEGLGFRLIAIAVVTFFGWAAFVIMPFIISVFKYTYFELLLPLAIVALSNPLTFTLTSVPFRKTVKKLKRIILFKLNRPVLIEDITNDQERLIATECPSDTMKDYSSLAESD